MTDPSRPAADLTDAELLWELNRVFGIVDPFTAAQLAATRTRVSAAVAVRAAHRRSVPTALPVRLPAPVPPAGVREPGHPIDADPGQHPDEPFELQDGVTSFVFNDATYYDNPGRSNAEPCGPLNSGRPVAPAADLPVQQPGGAGVETAAPLPPGRGLLDPETPGGGAVPPTVTRTPPGHHEPAGERGAGSRARSAARWARRALATVGRWLTAALVVAYGLVVGGVLAGFVLVAGALALLHLT